MNEEPLIYFEKNIEFNGYSYLTIFGRHINGGFICIPNWNIGTEASDILFSAEYNRTKLIKAGMKPEPATEISNIIDTWISEEYATVEKLARSFKELKPHQKIILKSLDI